MRYLRMTLFLIAILAVMPWGAFAKAHSLRAAPVDRAISAQGLTIAGPAPSGRVEMVILRSCPGPGMPGLPCQPDQGLLPAGVGGPDAGGGHSAGIPDAAKLQGIAPVRMLDPPRLPG